MGQIRLSHLSPLQQCDDDDPVLQMDKNIGQSLKISRFFILFYFFNQIVLLLCHVGYPISCNTYNFGRIDLVCWVQDSVAIFHCAFYIFFNLSSGNVTLSDNE